MRDIDREISIDIKHMARDMSHGCRDCAHVLSVRCTRRRTLRRSHRVRPWNARVVSSRLLRVVTRRVVLRRPSVTMATRAPLTTSHAQPSTHAAPDALLAKVMYVSLAVDLSQRRLATSRHGIATAYRSLARESSLRG